MKIPATIRQLHRDATRMRKAAHAPYSKFKVGSALLAPRGRVFGGCNVENASYGGTVCAERVAILKAVSEGVTRFTDIVVVTVAKTPAAPCALCLQTMAEFFDPETRIWLASPTKIVSVHRFVELLPKPFGPKQLAEAE
ncbi:MAG: cytidine deaminase [Bdellovibrionaceae bacterium]|nr:cytidine deaminase [Pseudobdellovibrionaceae bacterium]